MTFYLYHGVPEEVVGDVLHPLNRLREMIPEVYAREVKKYDDRRFLLDQSIPLLDCLWNDVLHFSPVHPQIVANELAKVYSRVGLKGKTFFEIDPLRLDPKKTVVFWYKGKTTGENAKLGVANFSWFTPNLLSIVSVFPQVAREEHARFRALDKSAFTYHMIPHVLFKGSLPIDGLRRVLVN